jgi:parallel beta-helix repeat protein
MGDPILENNNINNNTGDGILISTWKSIGPITWVFGTSSGQVKNNTIEFNNQTGINCDNNFWGWILFITTNIDNNTINDNNLTGIYALNCNPPIKNNTIFNNHQDGAWLNTGSDPFVYNNSIFNNTLSGLYVVTSSPIIDDNDITYNNWTGIECESNSNPTVKYNTITDNDHSGIYLFSNSDATIRYNDINDNNWSGIQSLGSSPNIRYNEINSNNQNGIYLYQRGTTAIRVRDNNITYNGWNGMECNRSSPVISMNNITNNSRNGLFLNNSSPTIQNNNQIMYNQFNGIACYLGSAPTITNDLKFNTLNGLYVNGSSPIVANSMISNNSVNGVYAVAGSSPNIENSTIIGNTEYAINITGNSHPASLNSSIDDAKIYFDDTASTYSVQWFLHVRTVDDNNVLLGMVDIWVNATTQNPSGIWSGQTRPDGLRPWLHVTEYVKTDNNGDHDGEDLGEMMVWNPYNITADKFGYGVGYAVPEPIIDQSMWVTVKLPKNKKPLPVSNIKPDITHDLRPTLTWDPSIDPDGQSVTYWVNVGTWPNGTNEVFNQSTTNTNYTFASDLTYGQDGVNTYFVLIYADDADGGFSRVNDQFDVVNNAPTQPGINITPRKPNTLMKSLTCTINTTSIDLDSDAITYTYRWYKNGVLQNSLLESATTELSDTISVFADDITFVIDDIWMCRVTANDGFVASLRDEDSVKFLNLNPTINPINDLYMDEDSEVTNWINLSEIFEDPDPPEDGTPYKFWVTGNNNITITIDFNGFVKVKPDPDWNGQETVTFWANDTGSKTPQVYTEAVIQVLPTNDVPNLVSVGKITIEENEPVSFLDTKGARQDQLFRLQIVSYDIDIENGEADSLIFTSNSSRITVEIDSYDPLKANLTFTPDNMDVLNKKLFVRLEVRDLEDGIIDDYVDIIIEVRNKNDPPTIISFTHEELDETFDVTASGTTKYIAFLDDEDCAYEDRWYNLTINGYDPDPGDVISYNSDDPRFFIKPDLDNKFSSIISFKPTQAEVGTIEFNITATDSEGAKDIVMIRLLIKNVNDRPDAKILKPTRRDFDIGETIDFEGDVYDEDLPDDTHTYQWTSNLDGELGTTITLNEVELTTGVHEITFTVTDQGNLKDSMLVTITIGGVDTDRDGLPDNWEEQYFNSLEWSAEDNPDNDKFTNLEEYGLKSDPSDPDSPTPQTSKSGGDDGADMAATIGVVIVIVIIIILILVFLVLRKRKSQEEEGPVASAPGMQPQAAPEKTGYTARPVPTLDELFPEGVPEEEVIVGKPKKVAEEESIGKKEKTLPVEIGLPPEELRKELRKKSKREEKKRDDEIKVDDRFSEEVLIRPEADEELIFERPEGAAEFQPMHEVPDEVSTDVPESIYAGASVKELDDAEEDPIIMDREPENLDEIYKEDDEEE